MVRVSAAGEIFSEVANGSPATSTRPPAVSRRASRVGVGADVTPAVAIPPTAGGAPPSRSTDYQAFLASKHCRHQATGIDVPLEKLNPALFDWQKMVVRWALRVGRCDLFEECGLGKSFQQLVWAEHVVRHTNRPVLLLCPLAVGWQTAAEAEKFQIGVPVKCVESQMDVTTGINIVNYEKLHYFEAKKFAGVVLDEASILKNFTGTTKRALCREFKDTPFRIGCTATPAPNDLMEIGNQAEFLSVMPSNEMLARWFINTGKSVGKYFLRPHGARDFWRWMASWAVCISRPSDIGFSDERYTLPPFSVHEHVVIAEEVTPAGMLFDVGKALSATTVHQEKRRALQVRADKVAEIVAAVDDYWAIWCDTDYEADALMDRLPKDGDTIEVRGSMPFRKKEDLLRAFTAGQVKRIVTKAELGGLGLNWQHCCNTTWFAGYSWEKYYQAIRRLYRFGQLRGVNVHLVMSELESAIAAVIRRKQADHDTMKCEMAEAMKEGMLEEVVGQRVLKKYEAGMAMEVPSWLRRRA